MKRFVIILVAALALPAFTMAQGNGKEKNKEKEKTKTTAKTNGNANGQGKGNSNQNQPSQKTDKQKHQDAIWGGTSAPKGGPKASKNQPAKVRAAFNRDYPNAGSVTWSKYRGDWTATFLNGPYWSTAVYHANGNRKDTRTQVPVIDLPGKIGDIFKKQPETRVEEAVKIETPIMKKFYRLKTILDGKTKYQVVDEQGATVTYNY